MLNTKTKEATAKALLIQRLRSYLTLQLQAYFQRDWETYDKLEDRIKLIEKEL